jgi:hypothetical protein
LIGEVRPWHAPLGVSDHLTLDIDEADPSVLGVDVAEPVEERLFRPTRSSTVSKGIESSREPDVMQTFRQAPVELIVHLKRELLEFGADPPLDLISGCWFNDEAQDHHKRRYQ